MPDLSLQKKAQRLRIYIGESDRWRGKSLENALLEVMRIHDMAGATVFRGSAGFGAHSHIHTASIEVLSVDLPVVIEVVDVAPKIASILEVIYPMVREGLITVEDVQIIKYTHRFQNPLPSDRLVSEVMTHEVVSLSPDMPVHLAWKCMLANGLKAMPVVEKAGKVVGILTDEDLLVRAGLQQRLSVAIRMDATEIEEEMRSMERNPLKVQDIMTKPVIVGLENETLGVATSRMVKAGLKRLPVVDDKGKLVGVLSRLDILRQVANLAQTAPVVQMPRGAVCVVKDVMSSNIPMISQDDDLSTIVEKFAKSSQHRLIVVNEKGEAIGLISDSDVVTRIQPVRRRSILDALRNPGKRLSGKESAFDLMSPGVLSIPPDMNIVEAVRIMISNARKWMVVVDENGKPSGLVDRQILLEAVTSYYRDENTP